MRIERGLHGALPWLGKYVCALVVGQARAWWHLWHHILCHLFRGQRPVHQGIDYYRARPFYWCHRTECTCGKVFFDADEI